MHRPFLDPVLLDKGWFLLLIPVALLMSIAYKAVRVHDFRTLPRQALAMTIQIILGIAGMGLVAFLIIEHILPRVAPITP